jgi:hypothetical protein
VKNPCNAALLSNLAGSSCTHLILESLHPFLPAEIIFTPKHQGSLDFARDDSILNVILNRSLVRNPCNAALLSIMAGGSFTCLIPESLYPFLPAEIIFTPNHQGSLDFARDDYERHSEPFFGEESL